jgi:hypothetical protein
MHRVSSLWLTLPSKFLGARLFTQKNNINWAADSALSRNQFGCTGGGFDGIDSGIYSFVS